MSSTPSATRDRPEPPDRPERRVPVWDLPTRLFHWLTVVLVAAAYVTQRMNWMQMHVRLGETLLALVLFRILWGCFGSETARFSHFVASPRKAIEHLRHLWRREPDVQVGHNAAGGWMVLLLLALLLVETLTGLYDNNDIADEGPLSEIVPAKIANAIAGLHAWGWDLLAAAVVLHVCAIAVYALVKGHNLVGPMVSGKKRLPASVCAPARGSLWLAALLMGLCGVVVALLAAYL
ncbi:cytochrome b/b6 domain-containing protein [Paraburkholderia sp. CNPSo 3076]|uniref:cytochrome b/b6 domain-containing protein n=1 Tax=Paraburkholderia sp. CNPSo 3076 TaxID=2940936 RepID=UPI002255DFF4|nr:cytochrome b/b6 domain-containing protein [Paraburkholderia sp. CNPSo 3076]MCX5539628.1 cytochrome b/b6 domain-containing protein [Paraburkholderia sp. CNPSo 3076]